MKIDPETEISKIIDAGKKESVFKPEAVAGKIAA